jgi:UDP-glucose 4-epimerase
MNDLAQTIIEKTNSSSKIRHIPYAEAYGDGFEDMERRVPNLDLIYSLTGWKPKKSLNDIIVDVVADLEVTG